MCFSKTLPIRKFLIFPPPSFLHSFNLSAESELISSFSQVFYFVFLFFSTLSWLKLDQVILEKAQTFHSNATIFYWNNNFERMKFNSISFGHLRLTFKNDTGKVVLRKSFCWLISFQVYYSNCAISLIRLRETTEF